MNKPVYVGLSILEINKVVMYEFWYDYVKPKCGGNAKICFYGYRQLYSLHENRLYL